MKEVDLGFIQVQPVLNSGAVPSNRETQLYSIAWENGGKCRKEKKNRAYQYSKISEQNHRDKTQERLLIEQQELYAKHRIIIYSISLIQQTNDQFLKDPNNQ